MKSVSISDWTILEAHFDSGFSNFSAAFACYFAALAAPLTCQFGAYFGSFVAYHCQIDHFRDPRAVMSARKAQVPLESHPWMHLLEIVAAFHWRFRRWAGRSLWSCSAPPHEKAARVSLAFLQFFYRRAFPWLPIAFISLAAPAVPTILLLFILFEIL